MKTNTKSDQKYQVNISVSFSVQCPVPKITIIQIKQIIQISPPLIPGSSEAILDTLKALSPPSCCPACPHFAADSSRTIAYIKLVNNTDIPHHRANHPVKTSPPILPVLFPSALYIITSACPVL